MNQFSNHHLTLTELREGVQEILGCQRKAAKIAGQKCWIEGDEEFVQSAHFLCHMIDLAFVVAGDIDLLVLLV